MGIRHIFSEVVEVKVHLPSVVMSELSQLEIDRNQTLERSMIEQEIQKMMLTIYGETKLPFYKAKVST